MASNALNTATAGLRVTQASIGVVAQNIANVGTAGYIKRSLSTVSEGIGNSGVASGTINRSLDEAAQTQLRLETSGSAYTGMIADVRGQLDKLYGAPGSASALDGVVNAFAQSLQGLAADPTSPPARSTAINSASSLASKIGDTARGVQTLRGATESQLATDVRDANALIKSIATLNTKIVASGDDAAKADLLDQRDQKITSLASYLDVKTIPQRDGSATVVTGSGLTLVERSVVTTLSFDEHPSITPEAAYSTDPTKRGVGTITALQPGGATIDLIATDAIRSGSLAAGIELRDTILPQAQRQLDDLAAGLSRSFSDKTVAGTQSGSGYAIDLSGMQVGNAITIPVKVGDKDIFVTLVASKQASASVDPSLTTDSSIYTQTFDISGGPATFGAAVVTALTALSTRLAPLPPSSPKPTIQATPNGAAVTLSGVTGTTVTGASASVTVPDLASRTQTDQRQFALFVDGASSGKLYTGSLDGGSQLTGFAQRISINPTVVQNTSALVNMSSSTLNGDTTRPEFLFNALTGTNLTFSAASGIGGVKARFSDSVQGFAQRIVDAQGAASANATDLDEGQSIALSTAEGRFASLSGVSIDEEMSNLIQLQTAYSANARVLTAARDMLDTLMRI